MRLHAPTPSAWLPALLLALLAATLPAEAGAAEAPERLPKVLLHGNALAGPARPVTVDQLDQLAPATAWTVLDPYKRADVRYQGIRLQDLVQALAPKAQKVRMRAVNDYITVFERNEWETLPILLATRDGDARMAVANKGPARIVYQQNKDNERALQVHAPKWIWQVVDVEFISH